MQRALNFIATMGLVLAACGDDPALPVSEPGLDAGAFSIQVTNVGNQCGDDAGCDGPGAHCMNVSSTNTRYPDGYCTADCEVTAECGPGAVCPVGEAIASDPSFQPPATWPHTCYRRCSVDGAALGGCRSGYVCRSLAEAYGMKDPVPAPMRETICIPVPRSGVRR